MGRTAAILLALLVATNATWLIFASRSADEPADGTESELAALRERVRVLEAERNSSPGETTPTDGPAATSGNPAGPKDESPRPAEPAARPPKAAPRPISPSAAAMRIAAKQVEEWKAAVLQIEDPGRREAGLAAVERGIRSEDEALATASLRALYSLRDAAYDRTRFRDAVRRRLEDDSDDIRRAATYAIMNVEPEPSDAARVVEILAAHPEDTGTLIVGAWMSEHRVEGTLADLYVRTLSTAEWDDARSIANQLRGMWVTAEVEAAAVDAYRRKPAGARAGLWFHILGQIRPTREPRVRLLFEILKTAGHDAPQLLDRALSARSLDPDAAGLAADLALQTLPEAPNALTRRLCLRVLRDSGTSLHVNGLRAYAGNPLVAEALRKEASGVIEVLEGR